ncbi:MAG: SMP-30/gluconolactonase/LRE family protein [Cyclobacteriaceae bacterium]|nr:SMP-30/gluconolactonase/LRE family protein [Cyclobacteriaceae bacterium]
MKSTIIALISATILLMGSNEKSEIHQTGKKSELYISSDFTPPGEYTSGIEGPACDKSGNIYLVNYQKQSTIGKVNNRGKSEVFIELPNGSIGNGIRFHSQGFMLIADYTNHNVLRVDMSSKQISVYANEPKMNQPNDIAIGKNDIIYASDPNWKESTGNIWRIDTNGNVALLEGNMGTTNGIEVGPKENLLFVNESVLRVVWVYDLSDDGNISNKREFISFADFGMDGMRCDVKGNLYITRHGKGTVAMVSPQGKLIREIKLKGSKPSNIAFGGKDGKTCFVTLQDRGCIETFRVAYPGRSWKLHED